MIQALITFIVLFIFVRWAWKVWGKDFTDKIEEEILDKDKHDSLKRKIEALNKEAKELKNSDDELKVSKMLKKVQTQVDKKEAELKKINKKIQNR